MTVDSVKAPASMPAVVPMSYPRIFAAKKALSRHVTHRTTVTANCGRASFFNPLKNWGPTLYPVVKRKRSKKTFLTVGGDLDIELTDDNTRQQRAHNRPETERSDLQPTDQKPESQTKKDGQFLVLLETLYKKIHACNLLE